jgi:hypothetical protein
MWFPWPDCSRCSLIIMGHCPHLEGWSVLQVSTVPYGKFQSLVIKMLSVILSRIQGDCKVTPKRMARAKTDTKWKQGCHASPVCGDFEVRSQCFSANTIWVPLTGGRTNSQRPWEQREEKCQGKLSGRGFTDTRTLWGRQDNCHPHCVTGASKAVASLRKWHHPVLGGGQTIPSHKP